MHEIPELDANGLRRFGLLTGGIVGGLFGLIFPWILDLSFPVWPWVVCGTLVVWAIAAPLSMRPFYRYWMRFGLLLNRITTPIVLGFVYFIVITPTALIMRLGGRDAMARRFSEKADSYRVPSSQSSKKNLEKPF